MKTFWAVIILAAVIIGVGVIVTSDRGNDVVTPGGNNNGNNNGGDGNGIEEAIIQVTSPEPNDLVTSPLTVTGKARGYWYFEASFPVKLLDGNGNQIAITPAQAQGEWMTTEFVPFSTTLNFTNPPTATGTLVLEKDNPSGLPENAGELRIPVRFNPSTTQQTRNITLYFYNESRDKDASGNTRCSAQGLVAFNRTIPFSNAPIQDAVKELLKGPTASERAQAPNTEFPLSGVALTGANLSGGVLSLSFSDPQNKTTGGACRVNILRAQIEATAKQFGGVTQVRYIPAGVFEP